MIYSDKFGYYSADTIKTYSKLEAIEKSINAQWHFNDQTYSDIDWTIIPPFDLWDIYKLRAKQIREQYDYIVLWYSGGCDSHNVLSAFIDSQCEIDEVATYWDYPTTKEKNSYINAEIFHVVLPHIKKLKQSGHNFKFRLIDLYKLDVDLIRAQKPNLDYMVNYFYSISAIGRNLLRERVKDWMDLINSGKKVAFVWGKEKPRVQYDNLTKKFYFQFFDHIDDCVSPYIQYNHNKGFYDEFFYWSPDCPLIPVIQSHIIKKFIETCDDKSFYSQFSGLLTPINPKLNMRLDIKTLKSLIYPKWSNNTFNVGKATFFIPNNPISDYFTFTNRDKKFLNDNTEEKTEYLKFMNSYLQKFKNKEFYTNKTGTFLNMKTLYSKRYYLS